MCMKCRKCITNPLTQDNLIDDDYGIVFELSLFITDIKKEVCDVLESFPSFFKKIRKEKDSQHAMFDSRPQIKKSSFNIYFIGL